jgi:hypothetical protein
MVAESNKRLFSSVLRCLLCTLIGLAIPTASQCQEVTTTQVDTKGIEFFEKHVRPVLVQHCYACHSTQSDELEGNLALDSPQGWLEGGTNGPAIVPGDASASLLMAALRYQSDTLQMPPAGPLDSQAVERIGQWIAMGAPSPSEKFRPANTPVSDPEAGKSHWAFRSLTSISPPESESQWPRTPIDSFILSRLQLHGLQPNHDATPRELARRLYVQLTGLLPTDEQLENYTNSDDPQSVERLVDELLSSPAFGERFGRHWLDLSRYADSNGLDENFLFREAWRYRNWVIGAINADVPFDRFLLEQIAGDLLPYRDCEQRDRQRIATGFLLIGPKVLLGNPAENQRMEIADEQLDTIGKIVLGQTLGCARCHDHKFDPIPTSDYYALAGIFTSTEVMQQRYMLGEQRVMERLFGLGEDGQDLNIAYEAYWRERPQLSERAKQAATILQLLKEGDEARIARDFYDRRELFADEFSPVELTPEQRLAVHQRFVDQLQNQLQTPPAIPPRAMIATDSDSPSNEWIRLAGQYTRKGEQIPRGFLQVLQDSPETEFLITQHSSGRIELARWLTDPDRRSGQLAARVLANRIWHQLFGVGLVRTVDNFGRTGELPTHPELLDFLAHRLIDHKWSVKRFVREIVLSHTLAQSSDYRQLAYSVDPENRLLWRYHRRRIDPETLRDALLSLSGQLDNRPFDSTVWYLGDQATAVGDNRIRRRTDFPCRSVYLPVIRNDLPELFEIFNFADPHATTGARPQTMVPTQGLFMLNSDLMFDTAALVAEKLLMQLGKEQGPLLDKQLTAAHSRDVAARIIMHVLQQIPSESEIVAIADFIDRQRSQPDESSDSQGAGVSQATVRAVTLAVQAVLASSQFQFID